MDEAFTHSQGWSRCSGLTIRGLSCCPSVFEVITKHISTSSSSSTLRVFLSMFCYLPTPLTTCSLLLPHFASPPLSPLSASLAPRGVLLAVCCHPSGLSLVAPGWLARTAWDSAHFPALIIPACSAGNRLLPLRPSSTAASSFSSVFLYCIATHSMQLYTVIFLPYPLPLSPPLSYMV